jgi:hypothetical protein
MRNHVRDYLTGLGTNEARELRAELEGRWRARDAGIPQWRVP